MMSCRFAVALVALIAIAACDRGADPPLDESPTPETPLGERPVPAEGAPADVDSDSPATADPAMPAGTGSALPAAPTGSALPPSPTSQQAVPPAAPAPAAQTPSGTAANDVLERAERVYADLRSMEADFVQEVYVPLLESTQSSRGKIYHRSPGGFAMRFTSPAGDVVVADGRYIWMYYPSTDPKQVMRAPLAQGGQQVDLHKEFLSDASTRFSATRTGTEAVGGRQTHALTLTPRGQSPYRRVRLWVDTQDSLVRRFEITEENGTIRDLQLSNLRPNVSLADALFRFTPPPGVQVHDF